MRHRAQSSLNIVGERWSLLLVRELTLGPRRYRDLATGLPGIPSNVLGRTPEGPAGRRASSPGAPSRHRPT